MSAIGPMPDGTRVVSATESRSAGNETPQRFAGIFRSIPVRVSAGRRAP
jgi:hypothetical protein